MATHKRPLSPHLQIYKPQITSFTSILHRATGVALSVGTLVLVYWLSAIAGGEEAYKSAQELLSSVVGLVLLLGWSFALFYHLCNGIRHLFWDAGYGFDIETTRKTGRTVLAMSVILTIGAWALAYAM